MTSSPTRSTKLSSLAVSSFTKPLDGLGVVNSRSAPTALCRTFRSAASSEVFAKRADEPPAVWDRSTPSREFRSFRRFTAKGRPHARDDLPRGDEDRCASICALKL